MAISGNRPLQRVRLGITGLAAVFLLVLAATVLVRPEAGKTSQNVEAQTGQAEPLAMLGVVPAANRNHGTAAH